MLLVSMYFTYLQWPVVPADMSASLEVAGWQAPVPLPALTGAHFAGQTNHGRQFIVRDDLNVSVQEFYNGLQLVAHDVVLCLASSVDKMDVLTRVIRSWDGPAVVSIYCRTEDEVKDVLMSSIPLLTRDGKNTALVFVRARHSDAFYPLNVMRNFAMSLVPVDQGYAIVVLDADMIMSRNSYARLRRLNAADSAALQWRAYVIPCFEFGNSSYDLSVDASKIPRTKSELLETTRNNLTRPSKWTYYPRGHCCTENDRWLYGTDTEPWLQSTYHYEYEPFCMLQQRSALPRYDEDFVFWGGEKQAYIWHLFAMGYRFWTVPDVFSVHHPHKALVVLGKGKTAAEDELIIRNRNRFREIRFEVGRRYGLDPETYYFGRVGLPPAFIARDQSGTTSS